MKDEIKEKCSNCEYSRQCFTMKQINSDCCLKDRENEKKDEIKEILDKINCALKIYERDKKLNQVSPKSIYFLSPKEQQILLDYITNLQEELKSANESITWWQNRFNALHKENKRLNNIIDELEKWLEDYIKLFSQPDMLEEQTLEDLKEVLDKLKALKEGNDNDKSIQKD